MRGVTFDEFWCVCGWLARTRHERVRRALCGRAGLGKYLRLLCRLSEPSHRGGPHACRDGQSPADAACYDQILGQFTLTQARRRSRNPLPRSMDSRSAAYRSVVAEPRHLKMTRWRCRVAAEILAAGWICAGNTRICHRPVLTTLANSASGPPSRQVLSDWTGVPRV
jgi:hypothetical protein